MDVRITDEYFRWMMRKVVSKDRNPRNYRKVLTLLFQSQFQVINQFDENRALDGENLRYQFGVDHGYLDAVIANELDNRPCSVLELMVALAIRCENQFAYDPKYGDRTPIWFWGMIDSLGLSSMTDDLYNEQYARYVVDRFIALDYKPNGEGGLFTIKDPSKDLRHVQIWYQMCAYLNEILF